MFSTETRLAALRHRALFIVMAVAVVLRVASALYHGSTIEPLPGVTDQISYHELAIRVVDGHGFSFATGWWPATRANQPTAHWSYLYVLFLAAIYSVAGAAPLVARLVQAVLVGILHTLLVWRIGRRVFGPAVGIVSASVTAVYGYFVYYAGALVTESLYILALLWVLDIATALAFAAKVPLKPEGQVRLKADTTYGKWILLGVALGLGAVLRQVFILIVPIILCWLAWQLMMRRSAGGNSPALTWLGLGRRMAVSMAIMLACIAPWTVRNYRAFDQFVLLNTNAGFVFFWANHPFHGNEFIPILPSDPNAVNYQTLLPKGVERLNEAELDRALLQTGLGFVKRDPVRYLRLSLSRTKEYFKFWPTADSSLVSNAVRVLSFGLVAPLLVGGILLTLVGKVRLPPSRAKRASASLAEAYGGGGKPDATYDGAVLLVSVAAVYSLVHLLTWTLVRYRLPIDAMVMPFAGVCLVFLFERVFSPLPRPETATI
jgi:hypothetical protein